jgi:hypothetical protein
MKMKVLVLAVVISMIVPAAAYASQSITENEIQILKEQVDQEYNVDNHDYKQQLWLNSSEDIHSNKPQLFL